jgi:hypothetical protein
MECDFVGGPAMRASAPDKKCTQLGIVGF